MENGKTEKEPSSIATIRFQDCDPFGHLYNARYIDYFINAREDHLAEYYALDIYERQKVCQENWLITNHQIAYIAPALFRERVIIKTRLLNFTADSILMEGIMLNAAGANMKSVIWTQFKYFSFAKGRALHHPADIMDFFGKISMHNEIHCSDFDQRVHSLLTCV
jgi:acyl-CoA thioester hydrolase